MVFLHSEPSRPSPQGAPNRSQLALAGSVSPDPDETESVQCLHSCSMLNSLLVLAAVAACEGCYRLRWSMAASGGIDSSLPVYCLLGCNLLCLPACLCTCLCGGRAGGRTSGRNGRSGQNGTTQDTPNNTGRHAPTQDNNRRHRTHAERYRTKWDACVLARSLAGLPPCSRAGLLPLLMASWLARLQA